MRVPAADELGSGQTYPIINTTDVTEDIKTPIKQSFETFARVGCEKKMRKNLPD
jgi:hypothetical protein